MTIAYHRYELHASAPIGARSQSAVRRGALLRIKGTAGGFGYADLHPWAELGDLDLEAQLAALARGEFTDLSRASLAFAALDGTARAEGRSLWEGVVVPPSHFLVPGGAGAACVEAALAEGFVRFKVKIGKDLNAESRVLRDMAAVLQRAPTHDGMPPLLRLDCNEVLARADFAACLAALPFVLPLIDFVEDPFPFEAFAWTETSRRLGVSFAADRAVISSAGLSGPQILKPARFGPQVPAFLSAVRDGGRRRQVVTSYLDHPLGQLGAAWVAAQLALPVPGETHGLVSHRVYAPNAFSERLGWRGPHLTLPPGLGFGFDDLLTTVDWTSLC